MKKTVAAYVMDRSVPWLRPSDMMKLDILYYAFSLVRDGRPGLYDLHYTELYKKMKLINPELKTIVSIGGWGAGGFSEAAFTAEGRELFAQCAVDLVREHNFDGVDMDWEYPCSSAANIASHPDDKQNFTYMLEALREKLDAYGEEVGRKMYLTAAVGAGPSCVRGMEPEKVGAILDYMNLMTYDFRNTNNNAGFNTNLYPQTGDEDGMSGEKCMRLYAAAGVPIEKMVLGSSFGSRMWRNTKGLSQPGETRRGGPPAPGAPRGPRFGFADIYYRHLQEGSEFKRYWDDQAKAAYLYNGTDFICYEDEESIAHKCKFVVEHNMAGIMYWQYGSDPTGRLLDAMTNPDNWKGAR